MRLLPTRSFAALAIVRGPRMTSPMTRTALTPSRHRSARGRRDRGDREGGGRAAARPRAGAARRARPGPRAARGRARPRQDADGAGASPQALGLPFRRVQFTPDLLPADVTGLSVCDPRTARFDFRPGPVFTQLLLADEINRTPPKTQAALLEAMEEPGHDRRRDPPAAAAVPRPRDRQPDRVRGHLRPARGAARPVPAPRPPRLPRDGRRAGAAAATAAARVGAADAVPGRGRRHGHRDARVARAGAGRGLGPALRRVARARLPHTPPGHPSAPAPAAAWRWSPWPAARRCSSAATT